MTVPSRDTVYPTTHELVIRENAKLRLADHVCTDTGWATCCVSRLADAMQADAESATTRQSTRTAFDALHALEHAPFDVLPIGVNRRRSAWTWVDEFPVDVPARRAAETDIAEAALAFSELWETVWPSMSTPASRISAS